ncbi:NAD(P)/FAD-dependent oxidoreductase [Gordonia aichiensis]|uniref:Putative oxidoreductase n=1 Tax=Gordonia aichiensis NBRC 108223 TaxID=1220583 RepID=L7KJM8_9ACTN|nr:FAD-binding oxidoreductase [Gordonia aichiensis]GAC49065.1 putative oxidoreductase [Gordonia aichiensis NBRC 108223]
MRNGDVSFWYSTIGPVRRRPPLVGDLDADVAVVGGGLTGLWSAYYLAAALPDARIVVLEKEFCGFGASGRNGGWLSAEVPGNRSHYAHIAQRRGRDGREANRRLTAAMRAGVDEVLSRIDVEGIDCDAVKSGVLHIARCAAQESRLREELDAERQLGATDWELLDADTLGHRLSIPHARAAMFSPQCARVNPMKLTRGVADAVERRGVTIHEDTAVEEISPRAVHTARGTVRAETILVCLEGFTSTMPGQHRALLPLNSSMIVTEPLPATMWDEIAWAGAELLGETAHAYTYSQRTADGRIALGGRGVPYRYGSGIDHEGTTQPRTAQSLIRALHELFPATADVEIAHAWCGVLGVSRDWSASIDFDQSTGIGSASGYVGSGLTTTNVAARTLRDLVVGQRTELTELPWVAHHAKKWEPEPLRWLGVATMYGAYRSADRREMDSTSPTTSVIARVADRISGRTG